MMNIDAGVIQKLSPYFIQGDMAGAMKLMETIPQAHSFLARFVDIFEREHYLRYDIPDSLNDILLLYQQYFRDVFYLGIAEHDAVEALLDKLRKQLNAPDADEETLAKVLEHQFGQTGYHFLGGRTNGHYGPYVWKTTVPTTYAVELTDTVSQYTVNILRGFIFRSWLDYLTFGAIGTGGWTSPDGTINCVEKAYDFESEQFKVSLLKHEAQHSEDLKRWPEMKPQELEYRAKLVELIFTEQVNLLEKFVGEADRSRTGDSHAMASARIADEFGGDTHMDIPAVQQKARELFARSTAEMTQRYSYTSF